MEDVRNHGFARYGDDTRSQFAVQTQLIRSHESPCACHGPCCCGGPYQETEHAVDLVDGEGEDFGILIGWVWSDGGFHEFTPVENWDTTFPEHVRDAIYEHEGSHEGSWQTFVRRFTDDLPRVSTTP
jgi:hypothetical protein